VSGPAHPSHDVDSDGISRWSPPVSLQKDHDGNLAGSAAGLLFRVDRNAAPLLGCDVIQGLGERPAMSGGVADRALTLSVRSTNPSASTNHWTAAPTSG